jgi:LmbE family N-acetylglucosaminyl deacetylase
VLELVFKSRKALRLLCIGAHSDDLEIGCAGTVFRLLRTIPNVELTWIVLSATSPRDAEARTSVQALARCAKKLDIHLAEFPDGFFPAHYGAIKDYFESLKPRVNPDLVLSHRLEDRHQDHRLAAELTWCTWRDHLILEYEIPKYEGDLGQPNFYVPLDKSQVRRKTEHLRRHFASQRSKDWFKETTFTALMRLRGVECRATSGFAEAFHARKVVIGSPNRFEQARS